MASSLTNALRPLRPISPPPKCSLTNPFSSSVSVCRSPTARPKYLPLSTTSTAAVEEENPEAMSLDNLRNFFDLNIGKWNGCFLQFDANGKLLQKVSTKLSVSSYGEDELISLIQTLYIKQSISNTSISGHKEEPEWAEYKIKESNMFTVDKYQQICLFANERAFALRYQTAGMLETVLRQGILGEDDTEEEAPKNLKLPSRKPSVVCENCLYSLDKDRRVRAFHILDPKGVLEMLLLFVEDRGAGVSFPTVLDGNEEGTDRISPFLGRWQGYSITKRSGVYGATIDEADTVALLERDDNGQITQVSTTSSRLSDTTTNVPWTGTMSDNLITFDRGYQMTLLPGGVYMGCPCDVSNHVKGTRSFHLELCWLESPDKRQRLVRTFDVDGLAVSSTYFIENKV